MAVKKTTTPPKAPEAPPAVDYQKHMAALAKVTEAQAKSLTDMEKRLEKLTKELQSETSSSSSEAPAFKKMEKLVELTSGRLDDLAQVQDKLKHSLSMAVELAKPATQVKTLSARVEALSRDVEALQRAQVTTADLKALEKRVLEAVEKRMLDLVKKLK